MVRWLYDMGMDPEIILAIVLVGPVWVVGCLIILAAGWFEGRKQTDE